jgi:hypothetical protein
VALDRGSPAAQFNSTYDKNLGYLAFGGLPPVKVTKKTATVKSQTFTIFSFNGPQYFWWTIPIDKYIFPGSDDIPTNGTAIIDTGSTLNWLPTEIAAAYNQGFQPPAVFDGDQGLYFVDCNATVPPLSVVLGNITFDVEAKDLIVPNSDGSGTCLSGVQDNGPSTPTTTFIL